MVASTDSTTPIYGSADKTSQRAAWTVGDKKTPVYEAGIANLTKDETTMLVHFGEGKSQQFTLVRFTHGLRTNSGSFLLQDVNLCATQEKSALGR